MVSLELLTYTGIQRPVLVSQHIIFLQPNQMNTARSRLGVTTADDKEVVDFAERLLYVLDLPSIYHIVTPR